MGDKIKWEVVDRSILTPVEKLENEAYDLLAEAVGRGNPHVDQLQTKAGQLLVKAMKMELGIE